MYYFHHSMVYVRIFSDHVCTKSRAGRTALLVGQAMRTELQLMLYGQNLKDAGVKVLQPGMTVKTVHNAESSNYLFVDMAVEKAGNYTIEITQGHKKTEVNYEIHNRRPGSESRVGLTLADVIYLIMPDRFANGDTSNDIVKGSTQMLDRNGIGIPAWR